MRCAPKGAYAAERLHLVAGFMLAAGGKESMFKKLLLVIVISFIAAWTLPVYAQTAHCVSDGISAMCAINPDPIQQGQQQWQQQQQQAQQAQQQLDQKISNLKIQYGAAAYNDCYPCFNNSMASDPWYASACVAQTQSCLETKAIQKANTPPTCAAGTTWYKGQCTDDTIGCQDIFGQGAYYNGLDPKGSGKPTCDCKSGYTWSQDGKSCVINDNAATTNSASQVDGAQTNIPNSSTYPIGTNIKASNGTVSLVATDGTLRPYTSAGAFLSYGFNSWEKVVESGVFADLLLPVGTFIPPRDGTIFCATETKGTDVKGECALITGGQKAAFTSSAVFTGLGFSFDRVQYGDSSFLAKTGDINNTSDAHRPGVLVNNNGTVQLVSTTGLLGFKDIDTFNSWGYSFNQVVPANAADQALSHVGYIPARQPGQLVPQ